MPAPNTTVGLVERKVLRVVETYGRTFLAAAVAQLILSGVGVQQIVTLSVDKKLAIAALAAGLQAVLSALGLSLDSGNRGTVSLLPAWLDPATAPSDNSNLGGPGVDGNVRSVGRTTDTPSDGPPPPVGGLSY